MNDKKQLIDHLNQQHQARKRKLIENIYARNETDILANMEPLTDDEIAAIDALMDEPAPPVDPDVAATQLANFLDYVRSATDARRNRDIAESILSEND